ncbi:probable RNA-directed DNA polymerase from transposon BS isoform X1 [Procambarus clarkii]|uniref:probable RNA-directed DNA polymerase from transposon BS isoform X1 n=1 Tax=Procambarus clarkii TaxID=6728 RepID=UPI00374243D1
MPLSSLFANQGLWEHPLRTFALFPSSCVCKLFERMVNVRLMWFLVHHYLLSPSQFGFRKCRSTTDVLVNLEVYIRTAFAAKTSVVAVLFDLEKAYDATWRYILSQLHSFGLRGHLPLFLCSFLSRRSFWVRLGAALSASFQQYEGVPQGSVLSTTLFLVALKGLLSSLPSSVFSALYVDDLTLCCQGDDSPLLQRRLQLAIDVVSSWATDHGFKFSTTKICAMTFTRKQVVLRPSLSLYGHPLEYKDSAKLLGSFLDTRLSWFPHISYLRVECSKALTLLRVLSHTSWGADRRTLLTLHSSLVLSKLDYGCPAYLSASPSTFCRLDALHHIGLRLSSGAFRSTPVLSL